MGQTDYYPVMKMNASHKRFHNLCKGISKSFDVVVFCPNIKLKYELTEIDKIKILRVPSLKLPLIERPLFKFLGKYYIERFLKEFNKTDGFIYWYNSAVAPSLSPNFKCLRIWDIMGVDSKEILRDKKSVLNIAKSKIYLKLERSKLDHTDLITTINVSHKEIIKDKYSGKIVVLRDAVDETEIQRINEDMFALLKDKYKNRFIITFIGSFDRKRIDDLLEVMPALRKLIPKISLLVVGEGRYLNEYAKLTAHLGINENVDYLGYMSGPQLNTVIKISDICFSDVFLEGFPYKIFEYALFEKPIVVKDTVSIREILVNNKTACFYNDKQELIDVIYKLYQDTSFRTEIGKNVRLETMKNHTWERRVNELSKIINDLSFS